MIGPMDLVGVDCFELDRIDYLIMVDKMSGYQFADKLRGRGLKKLHPYLNLGSVSMVSPVI